MEASALLGRVLDLVGEELAELVDTANAVARDAGHGKDLGHGEASALKDDRVVILEATNHVADGPAERLLG